MNQKGILFSVMILFIILSIISLNVILNDNTREAKEINEIAKLISIGNNYRNVTNQMITLDRFGHNKEVFERTLPFDYNLNKDENTLLLEHSFPISQTLFNETFNTLNLLEVFLEDKNTDNIFDDMNIDLNVPKNSAWGGNDKLSFLINPFCYSYLIDNNSALLKKSSNSKCVSAFSSGDFKMINFSLKIKGGDFNTLTCNGSSCPNDSYSTTQPYYSLTIDTSQCSGCSMPQTTASAHFGVGDNFTIQIACVGSCTSEPITITNNSLDFNFNSNGNQVDSDIELVFNENITDFFIPDINVLVYSENILKRG